MLTLLFWVGLMVQALIISRGISGRLAARYPYFFLHIYSVLIATIVCYALILSAPQSYATFYWSAQFLTMLTGCGIILEVLRHVVSFEPDTRQYVRALRCGLYVAIAVLIATLAWTLRHPYGTISKVNIERDFRLVQSFFLLAISALVAYRGLVMGKNLKGMFLGYGLYVAASLTVLAVRSYEGPSVDGIWTAAQPVAYFICLSIWLFSMWTYDPSPSPTVFARPQGDAAIPSQFLPGGTQSRRTKAVRS